MIRNQELNILFLKTGLVTALVAVVAGVQVDLEWAAHFAVAGLVGLANWYLLAVMLLALTTGEGTKALFALAGKLVILTAFAVIILPLTGLSIFPFLLGFNMFLLTGLLESAGLLIAERQQNVRGARPLPRSLKALLTGRPNG